MKKHLLPILLGVLTGVLCSAGSIYILAKLFELPDVILLSLLPKSVTSAIGAPLAEMAGGMAAVCTAAIIITGILGGMVGEILCKIFRITDPVAQGVAYGTASHVAGTAKASELSPLIGAVSSLSLVIAGLMTAVILPFLFPYV